MVATSAPYTYSGSIAFLVVTAVLVHLCMLWALDETRRNKTSEPVSVKFICCYDAFEIDIVKDRHSAQTPYETIDRMDSWHTLPLFGSQDDQSELCKCAS